MATVTSTNINGAGAIALTTVALNGSSDTFTLTTASGELQMLYLHNPTGSPISPTITGDAASAAYPVGGAGTVDLSGGYAVGAVAAGESVLISTDTISRYLTGTITISSGSGLEAIVMEKGIAGFTRADA